MPSCHLSHQPRCINSLRTQITKVDAAFDQCSTIWCSGEAEGFFTEKYLDKKRCHIWYPLISEQFSSNFKNWFRYIWIQSNKFPIVSDIAHLRFHNSAEAKMKEATYVCRPHRIPVPNPAVNPIGILSGAKVLCGQWRGNEDQDLLGVFVGFKIQCFKLIWYMRLHWST